MAALAIGVGGTLLQGGTIVHQGIVPEPWVRPVQGGLDEGHQLCVRNPLAASFPRRKEQEQVHGADVGFYKNLRPVEGKGSHRPRRVGSDSFESLQLLGSGGKNSSELLHHLAAGRLQISCPPVVSQTAPGRQHLGKGCRRKVSGSGKGLKPGQVLRHHPLRLGLLQHQLRHQNGIGVTGLTPRKGAALLPVKFQNHGLELGDGGTIGQRHGGRRLRSTQAQWGIFHSACLHQSPPQELLENQLHNLLWVVAGGVYDQLAEAVVVVVDVVQPLVALGVLPVTHGGEGLDFLQVPALPIQDAAGTDLLVGQKENIQVGLLQHPHCQPGTQHAGILHGQLHLAAVHLTVIAVVRLGPLDYLRQGEACVLGKVAEGVVDEVHPQPAGQHGADGGVAAATLA